MNNVAAAGSILANDKVVKFFSVVVNPVVTVIFGLAVFYFIWGVFNFIRAADDPAGRQEGGRHIIFGILGIFIMFSVWGIMAVIKRSIGL